MFYLTIQILYHPFLSYATGKNVQKCGYVKRHGKIISVPFDVYMKGRSGILEKLAVHYPHDPFGTFGNV